MLAHFTQQQNSLNLAYQNKNLKARKKVNTERDIYNKIVLSQYCQMNQKLKDNIKKMRDLDEVPAMREGNIR